MKENNIIAIANKWCLEYFNINYADIIRNDYMVLGKKKLVPWWNELIVTKEQWDNWRTVVINKFKTEEEFNMFDLIHGPNWKL